MIKLTFADKDVLIFRDIGEISSYILEKWEETAERAIFRHNEFTVAISGGRTPVHIYRALSSQKSFPWEKTQIFMVDERYVPYESDENNFRMINETLLLHVDIPARNIHPIMTSGASARDCAAKYQEDIVSFFKLPPGAFPVIDLVLLGIGEDGHTASLFPGNDVIQDTSHIAVAVTLSDALKKDRITLTLPVINNASNAMFITAGESKAGVVRKIMKKEDRSLPAAMVKPQSGTAVFLVDKDAGSLLANNEI